MWPSSRGGSSSKRPPRRASLRWWYRGPSSADAPSNRLNLALIGAGNQSRVDLPAVLRFDDVQVVAVCDVNKGSYGYARPEHFLGREPVRDSVNEYYAKKTGAGTYRGCDIYADFREVLARDDIDAVMVILPDHWHALVSVLACRAGKDVYCQKPMSLTVHDGQQMIKAVREHQRILQVGSQYRSNAVVRRVAELVRNGRIGKVQRAIAIVNDSGPGPGPGWQPMPVPDGFDYDFWLGPAPQAPYHIDRCLYRFRFHLDYSGGQVTNTGHHANDIVQWVLGLDGTEPVEYEDLGSVWPPAGHLYTTAMKTAFRARHANGIELICQTQDPGFGVVSKAPTAGSSTRATRSRLRPTRSSTRRSAKTSFICRSATITIGTGWTASRRVKSRSSRSKWATARRTSAIAAISPCG